MNMKLALIMLPMLGVCQVIATYIQSPPDAYAPGPAPGQPGRDPPTTRGPSVGVFDVMDYGAVADEKTDSSLVHSQLLTVTYVLGLK